MPRPTVLDDIRRAEVLALASHGLSHRAIADYLGCAANTIANTAQRDPAFDQQLRHAAQHFVCSNIELIQRHAAQSPKNAIWLLERTQPEHFARRSPGSITPAQQARQFQTWTRALVAAVPAEFRAAVAQAAIELAATQLAPDLHGDDEPLDADDSPDADDPIDARGPGNDATGVPPVPAGENTPSLARPANVSATGVPPVLADAKAFSLPTPTSPLPATSPLSASPPLPASAPPRLDTPDIEPDPNGPTPWDHLELPDLIAACRAHTESADLYDLIVVEVVGLLKQGLLSRAREIYCQATGATWGEAIDQVGRLEEYRRMGAYANGDWPNARLNRAGRARAACKRAARNRATPTNLAPTNLAPTDLAPTDLALSDLALSDLALSDVPTSDLAPSLPAPTSPFPASAPPSSAASFPLAAMQFLFAFFLVAAACWHAPEIERDPRHVTPALLKNPSLAPAFGRVGLDRRALFPRRVGDDPRTATTFAGNRPSITRRVSKGRSAPMVSRTRQRRFFAAATRHNPSITRRVSKGRSAPIVRGTRQRRIQWPRGHPEIEHDPRHVTPALLKNPSLAPAFGRVGLARRASSPRRVGNDPRTATRFAGNRPSVPGRWPGLTARRPWPPPPAGTPLKLSTTPAT